MIPITNATTPNIMFTMTPAALEEMLIGIADKAERDFLHDDG